MSAYPTAADTRFQQPRCDVKLDTENFLAAETFLALTSLVDTIEWRSITSLFCICNRQAILLLHNLRLASKRSAPLQWLDGFPS